MVNKKSILHQLYANNSMISLEGFCLSEHYLSKLQRDSKQRQYEVLVLDISNAKTLRRFYALEINAIDYWADVVTGTLYKTDGTCMTSPVRRLIGEPIPISTNVALDRLAA